MRIKRIKKLKDLIKSRVSNIRFNAKNVDTKLIIDFSIKYNVKKFVLISSDKAVNPTNVMGASKRICELYLASKISNLKNKTKFIITRFGNVLGSNGSVVPIFEKQIENIFNITDEAFLVFDGDVAGQKALHHGSNLLETLTIRTAADKLTCSVQDSFSLVICCIGIVGDDGTIILAYTGNRLHICTESKVKLNLTYTRIQINHFVAVTGEDHPDIPTQVVGVDEVVTGVEFNTLVFHLTYILV